MLRASWSLQSCRGPTATPTRRSGHALSLRRCSLALLLASACGAPISQTDSGDDGGPDASTDAGSDGGNNVRHVAALVVAPAQLTMQPGQEAPITATASYDDGSSADVSGSVTWTSSAPASASVLVRNAAANDVVVRALVNGASDVTAQTGAITSNTLFVAIGPQPADGGTDAGADAGSDGGVDGGTDGGADGGSLPHEVRAIWVTRFAYSSAQQVRTIIDSAAGAGFNVVFFQVRGAGDAFYHSTHEPWAKSLTGTLGQDPGWDPLSVAVAEAHLRGIQLHAYVNVFSAFSCSGAACACRAAQGQTDSCALPDVSAAGAPTHWLRANPGSMVVDSSGMNRDTEYFWFSPADAAYRAHVLDVVRELLTNYDLDGLHLDRVRYPGTWSSYDPASVAAYNALPTPRPSHDDWQRENVSSMVGAIYDVVKTVRPSAVLSASVWGIYQPLPSCSTSQGYGQYYQDSLNWLTTSRIDWLVPMIYWDIGTGCTDWSRLLNGFIANNNNARIVAGMHALDSSTFQPARIRGRIDYSRMVGTAGTSIFASTYLDQNATGWSSFDADGGVYQSPAAVPPITWR